MDRTLYYRNLIVFLVFVAILFATPFLFAEVSSPSLIRLNSVNLDLHNRTNANRINATLGPNSVIRLPDPIINNLVTNSHGEIAMAETLKVWHTLAARDHRLIPRQVNGRLLYPVKILRSSDARLDVNSRASVGYVALDRLRPGTFRTVRSTAKTIRTQEGSQAKITTPKTSDSTFFYDPNREYQLGPSTPRDPVVIVDEDDEDNGDFSETTTSPRPVMRPNRPRYSQRPTYGSYSPTLNPEFQCHHNDYSRSFRTNNCFTQEGMDLIEKAEHLLGDLEAINQWRSQASGSANQPAVDPRFSLCISHHETGGTLAPNTSSGAGDYGLYQIRKTTGAGVLKNFGMITPGFTHLKTKSHYHSYNGNSNEGLHLKMVDHPLAQSDLHHSIVIEKARIADNNNTSKWTGTYCANNITYRLGMGTATSNDYQCLADFYNAGSKRESYAQKIRTCYDRLKQGIVTSNGQILNKTRLKWALDGALYN